MEQIGSGLADDLEARGLAALRSSPETAAAEHAAGADGLAAAARGILIQRDGEAFESLSTITAPTLIVVGANDERFLAAADAMARRIPGARKLIIENAGHAANMDQPAQLQSLGGRVPGGPVKEETAGAAPGPRRDGRVPTARP